MTQLNSIRETFEGSAKRFIDGPRPESAAGDLSKSDVFANLVVEILKQHGDMPPAAIASALEIGFHIGCMTGEDTTTSPPNSVE